MSAAETYHDSTALRALEIRTRRLPLEVQMVECINLLQTPEFVVDDLVRSVEQVRELKDPVGRIELVANEGLRMDALSTQIASRTFNTVRRGYEPGSVDAYLEKIGEQIAKLEDEIRVGRKRIEVLELRTKDVPDADTVVRTAFLAAAASKAKLIAEAEARAREIIADAKRYAASLNPSNSDREAESLLFEARRRLEESERSAMARREQAEREAAEIISAARSRVLGSGTPDRGEDPGDAADELSRLVETLGSLKEAARQGLERAVSLEADIEAVIAEH